jgi:hypothetical protein
MNLKLIAQHLVPALRQSLRAPSSTSGPGAWSCLQTQTECEVAPRLPHRLWPEEGLHAGPVQGRHH